MTNETPLWVIEDNYGTRGPHDRLWRLIHCSLDVFKQIFAKILTVRQILDNYIVKI